MYAKCDTRGCGCCRVTSREWSPAPELPWSWLDCPHLGSHNPRAVAPNTTGTAKIPALLEWSHKKSIDCETSRRSVDSSISSQGPCHSASWSCHRSCSWVLYPETALCVVAGQHVAASEGWAWWRRGYMVGLNVGHWMTGWLDDWQGWQAVCGYLDI